MKHESTNEPVAFTYWFYNEPHRQKYTTDHPAFLAAQEAWEFQEKRKGIPSGFIRSLVFIDENGNESFKDEPFYTHPQAVPEAQDQKKDEALRLALEALKNPWKAGPHWVADAIILIEQALEKRK